LCFTHGIILPGFGIRKWAISIRRTPEPEINLESVARRFSIQIRHQRRINRIDDGKPRAKHVKYVIIGIFAEFGS